MTVLPPEVRTIVDETSAHTNETDIYIHIEAWETHELVGITTTMISKPIGRASRILSMTTVTGRNWGDLR